MSLGQRLKARRKELGREVNQLAKACKVTPSAVYQWEAGETKGLRPENLVSAADFLKTTCRWLVFGRGAKEFSGPLIEQDENDLLTAYNQCDETTKRAILVMATQLARQKKSSME